MKNILILVFIILNIQIYSQSTVLEDKNLSVKILNMTENRTLKKINIIVKNISKNDYIYIPNNEIRLLKKDTTGYIDNSVYYTSNYIELSLLNPNDSIVFEFNDLELLKIKRTSISVYYMLITQDTSVNLLKEITDNNRKLKLKIYSDINTFISINSRLIHYIY